MRNALSKVLEGMRVVSSNSLVCSKRAWCIAALSIWAAGCGKPTPRQIEEQKDREYNIAKPSVVKFGGTVTVDGLPPNGAPGDYIVVMLWDPKSPPTNRKPPFALCRADGSFEFASGVPPGSYILLFAELHEAGLAQLRGPDKLNNLYNDPDRNDQIKEFKIALSPPGITDHVFALTVAGKQAITTPGPHAVLKVGGR